MALSHLSDRLGALDTLFLFIEKKEMPLHIGGIFIFDGPISLTDLRSLIEAKLPQIPRYRQRLAFPPLNIGYPTWEWDPDFDIDRHIRYIRIRPGTKESLAKTAGNILSQLMDRNHPLWDLTLIDGLRGRRSALLARAHHCLVDGIAAVALMQQILDTNPVSPSIHPRKPAHPTQPARENFLDALASSYSQALARVLALESTALELGGSLLRELLEGALPQALGGIGESLRPLEPFPFKAPCAGPRAVSWTEFSLAQVNAIREVYGVKVNDILLMALGAAMRRYAKLHRLAVKDRVLRLMVPVNLRNQDQKNGFGNRISLAPVNIPLDINDLVELLKAIHQRTETLKQIHAAEFVAAGGTVLATMPVPLQAILTGMLSNTVPVLPFDMVCTNIPGPQSPLYLLGRKVLTYYPYVPIGDFMGVGCAMASYNGTLFFSLTGDCACAPDLDVLRDFLYDSLCKLRDRSMGRRTHPKSKSSDLHPISEPSAGAESSLHAERIAN